MEDKNPFFDESDVTDDEMKMDRGYDFLWPPNITKDLFEDLSGYQKVLLGTYATGDHTIKDLATMLGVSFSTANTNVHDASTALFNKLKKKFDSRIINAEGMEKMNLENTLDAVGERNHSNYYHKVIEPQILAIALAKGYIRPADNEEFRWLREHHHVEIKRAKVAKRMDEIIESVKSATLNNYARDLPGYQKAIESIGELKREILKHEV